MYEKYAHEQKTELHDSTIRSLGQSHFFIESDSHDPSGNTAITKNVSVNVQRVIMTFVTHNCQFFV